MRDVVLGVMAVFFAGMGVYGLLAPAALVRPFGVSLAGADARTEVRAVYGGFGVAIAVLLVLAMLQEDIRRGAALAVAFALFGMAFGRVAARMAERPSAFYPSWFYFWVEAAGGAALGWVALG